MPKKKEVAKKAPVSLIKFRAKCVCHYGKRIEEGQIVTFPDNKCPGEHDFEVVK